MDKRGKKKSLIQTVGDCIHHFLPSMAVPRSAWGAALAVGVFVTCFQCFSYKKRCRTACDGCGMVGEQEKVQGAVQGILCFCHLTGGDDTSGGRRREGVKLKSWQSVATTTSLCSRDLL